MERILQFIVTFFILYFIISFVAPLLPFLLAGGVLYWLYINYKYKKQVKRFEDEVKSNYYYEKQEPTDIGDQADIIEADFTVVEEREEEYVSQKQG